MEGYYYEMLPEDIRGLVDEIEEGNGVEIDIEIDSGRNKYACDVTENTAKIIITNKDSLNIDSAFHELLHIQRFYLLRVPKIILCLNPDRHPLERQDDLSSLDNNIEHLFVVPNEIERFPDRLTYWADIIRNKFKVFLENNNQGDACINWVFIRHVLKNGQLEEDIYAILEHMGISEKADQLYEEVMAHIESKEDIAKICLRAFEVDNSGICFEYISNKTSTEVELN